MILNLKSVGRIRGCYGPNKDQFPARAAYLAPDVADAFLRMLSTVGPQNMGFSDIWRSAESSLAAMESKAGVQPPGYSGHGFGVSFDLDVPFTMKVLGKDYASLVQELETFGWYCYRRDRQRGPEDWHFNYFGADAPAFLRNITMEHSTWALGAEQAIQKRYPGQIYFRLNLQDIQKYLQRLHLYSGEIDGQSGPLTRQAIGAFCRTWHLNEEPNEKFQRTLAFVAAELRKDDSAGVT